MQQSLTPELCEAVIMQLPPRHVYKLMQTNKQFCDYCKSEAYWARVALYLLWSPETRWADDMVLLQTSYDKAMEAFVSGVREEVQERPLVKLLEFAQECLDVGRPVVAGQTAFQLVQRCVEDQDNLQNAIQRATVGSDVPRRPGFITGSRRAKRATSKFLRALEDEEGMDLQTKLRMQRYARELIEDITERRGRVRAGTYFELFEEDIDATYIYL
jgi:hypothetical protein